MRAELDEAFATWSMPKPADDCQIEQVPSGSKWRRGMAALTDTEKRRLRTAFDQQATEKNMERVWRHAESLVRQVGARTGRHGPTSHGDLVHAAVLGTLEGRHRWDHQRI